MRWWWVSSCLVPFLGITGLDAKDLSPRDIYEQASPAVVMVMGHPETGKSGSGGTGSIIHADGLILTNAHVVIEERTGKPYPRLSVFLKPPRVTGDSNMDLSRMLRARLVADRLRTETAGARELYDQDPLRFATGRTLHYTRVLVPFQDVQTVRLTRAEVERYHRDHLDKYSAPEMTSGKRTAPVCG